eukprot:6212120-Pleurochrysis_carterae.AAC.1
MHALPSSGGVPETCGAVTPLQCGSLPALLPLLHHLCMGGVWLHDKRIRWPAAQRLKASPTRTSSSLSNSCGHSLSGHNVISLLRRRGRPLQEHRAGGAHIPAQALPCQGADAIPPKDGVGAMLADVADRAQERDLR